MCHLESGQTVRTLQGHTDKVTAVVIVPGGLCALSSSEKEWRKVLVSLLPLFYGETQTERFGSAERELEYDSVSKRFSEIKLPNIGEIYDGLEKAVAVISRIGQKLKAIGISRFETDS